MNVSFGDLLVESDVRKFDGTSQKYLSELNFREARAVFLAVIECCQLKMNFPGRWKGGNVIFVDSKILTATCNVAMYVQDIVMLILMVLASWCFGMNNKYLPKQHGFAISSCKDDG